ncbi:recombinase family protein [Silicimonas algicola]|uniref:DNA invertase Pin-like site-specific DNA recombinase n=1 Tax=Silicimonas algicola TaxID=1826607 RepID=A0A316G2W4_9RHOB|nr:recombinase family protein [Silicimonas algicola]AZQ65901.1 recombinase family protein [Silicimonas algicola]PWK54715.1 DNA invertase Pin-like site-specific DNA recombinase [Silicimonas algicola]
MMAVAAKVRCAIYTRKSSDEGLEQSFNSLDAQYEACAAYVASQRQEGWILAKDRFDDGGVSGGTLERPALQQLLSEIDAGRVAMVVVYKIDRLTRSLADFAKLVERLDASGCSFVSVTQAFNTASSMGRLTLNVLLSFAQFEREVTAERIRDKIAASKRQGMWMGGIVPLGYDPHPDPKVRELVVNEAEAETVRTIFDLYDRHGNLILVAREAAALGLRSKRYVFRTGRTQGGNVFSTGHIHKVLLNPVYLGRIRHKELVWPGRHQAILNEDLWNRVQENLQASARRGRGRRSDADPALLAGKLRDETGDRLTPTSTMKAGRRHRYYVSNRLVAGGPDPTGWRLPASKLESLVAGLVADHLERAASGHQLLTDPDLRAASDLATAARALAASLRRPVPSLLRGVLVSGVVGAKEISLKLDRITIATALSVSADSLASEVGKVSAEVRLRRRGVEVKLIVGDRAEKPDPVLLKTLQDAHRWTAALRTGTPMGDLAAEAGHHEVHIRTRAPFAFLSPRIQRAIATGTLAPELTLRRMLVLDIPLDWIEQERLFGLP